jgi:hypothetical protein
MEAYLTDEADRTSNMEGQSFFTFSPKLDLKYFCEQSVSPCLAQPIRTTAPNAQGDRRLVPFPSWRPLLHLHPA